MAKHTQTCLVNLRTKGIKVDDYPDDSLSQMDSFVSEFAKVLTLHYPKSCTVGFYTVNRKLLRRPRPSHRNAEGEWGRGNFVWYILVRLEGNLIQFLSKVFLGGIWTSFPYSISLLKLVSSERFKGVK